MEQIQNLAKGDLNFFINQNVQIDIPNFVIILICAVILSFFVPKESIEFWISTIDHRIKSPFFSKFVMMNSLKFFNFIETGQSK